MEVNRIKWSEEMNDRCIDRVRYLYRKAGRPAQKQGGAPEPLHDGRNAGVIVSSVRAIGVGESIECKWMTDETHLLKF